MNSPDKRLAALAAPVLLALGIAGANAGGSTQNGPIQCGIEYSSNGGMVTFNGVLVAKTDLSGSYTFRIESSGHGGSTNIRQGGNFSARAGEELQLGQASLSSGGQYGVKFEVTANGQTYDCSGSVPV